MTRGEKIFTNTIVFNYVSDKVYTFGTSGFNPIMEKAVTTLDFVSSAKLNDMFTVTLKATNLLNTTYELSRENTKGGVDTLSEYQKGITISAGLSMNF